MYEATFSIGDESTYTKTTEGSDCQISLWCNDHCDLLYLSGTETDAILDWLRTDVGISDLLQGDTETVVITDSCLKEHETGYIEQYLEAHRCLLLPPLRYEHGAKHCRILSLDPASLTKVYQDLTDDGFSIDVRRKRELKTLSPSGPLLLPETLVPDLTPRQREAITTAVAGGYYELPREMTTADIAQIIGVSRRTAEDHLRRAERKLITSLIGHLFGYSGFVETRRS